EVVRAADVVITMGCGDACPIFPGKRYEDWELEDPAGQDVEAVRPIRDEIERRVRALLSSPGGPSSGGGGRAPQPAKTSRSCVSRSGTTVQLTQRPTLSLVMSPAS